jgi:hypothetical protein
VIVARFSVMRHFFSSLQANTGGTKKQLYLGMDEGQYRLSALETNSGSNCDFDGEILWGVASAARL